MLKQYKPLLIIVGLIALTAIISSWQPESGVIYGRFFMAQFMAGFFLVFAGFKLLDIKGFAEGYSKYDLLAAQWKEWGYLYPFIELMLGFAYIHMPLHPTLNIFTCIVMLFGSLGVLNKLARGESFQCACLGTIINVPLTYVTLVEDIGMAAMALAMLLL